MNKLLFYPKLALTNLKKNKIIYLPYMLATTFCVAMFYTIFSLGINDGIETISGAQDLKLFLRFGTIIMGIFSVIFLFYTNSFIVKRRNKEIGLYSVLGMGKGHIGLMMFFESVFTFVIAAAVGLIAAFIGGKLIFLIMLKLAHFDIHLVYSIEPTAIIGSIVLFGFIFVLTFAANIIRIIRTNPIEILHGGKKGEKEPKAKIILTLLGIICLGCGYAIAIFTTSPLSAIFLFFIAVLLVMAGTYLLFTTGSISLLKILKKNKKFYYKPNNFISTSGMMYRMKQNAIGLANICILCTCVLVMLSTTGSLYIGIDDAIAHRYPTDECIALTNASVEGKAKLVENTNNFINSYGVETSDIAYYSEFSSFALVEDNLIHTDDEVGAQKDYKSVNFMYLDDYNRLTNSERTLDENQCLVFEVMKDYEFDTVLINDKVLSVVEDLKDFPTCEKTKYGKSFDGLYIVVNNPVETIGVDENGVIASPFRDSFTFSFNIVGDDDVKSAYDSALINSIFFEGCGYTGFTENRTNCTPSVYSMYGGFLFLGVFLAITFLLATVLIIYYKQLSEGMDDKDRYAIMEKVGMNDIEIKRCIKKQILMVFFLPLITAIIHLVFAFNIIRRLLVLLNLTNVPLFIFITVICCIIFALIYGAVFAITARLYYKIVK